MSWVNKPSLLGCKFIPHGFRLTELRHYTNMIVDLTKSNFVAHMKSNTFSINIAGSVRNTHRKKINLKHYFTPYKNIVQSGTKLNVKYEQ